MRDSIFKVIVTVSLASTLLLAGCSLPSPSQEDTAMKAATISANDAHISVSGRTFERDSGALSFGFPGVQFGLNTEAKRLVLVAESSGDGSYLGVQVGDSISKIKLAKGVHNYTLFSEDEAVARHVRLVHHSETWHGTVTLHSFTLTDGRFLAAPAKPERRILVLGDSVTCGEGADPVRQQQTECKKDTSWWNASNSYGLRTGAVLNAEVQLVCYGGRGLIRSWNGKTDELNLPDFYDLALAEDSRQHPWNAKAFDADAVVVSVGTNDFSLGIGELPEREEYVSAYVAFVQRILADYPNTQVFLTEGSIVNDQDDPARPQKTVLREYIAETKRRVGGERVHIALANRYRGDSCDAHPTGDQHAQMATDLVSVIKQVMNW